MMAGGRPSWLAPDHQERPHYRQQDCQQAPSQVGKERQAPPAEVNTSQQLHAEQASQQEQAHQVWGYAMGHGLAKDERILRRTLLKKPENLTQSRKAR